MFNINVKCPLYPVTSFMFLSQQLYFEKVIHYRGAWLLSNLNFTACAIMASFGVGMISQYYTVVLGSIQENAHNAWYEKNGFILFVRVWA